MATDETRRYRPFPASPRNSTGPPEPTIWLGGREEAMWLVASLAFQDFSNSATAHDVILLDPGVRFARNGTTRAVALPHCENYTLASTSSRKRRISTRAASAVSPPKLKSTAMTPRS